MVLGWAVVWKNCSSSQLFSVLLFPQLFSTLYCAFRSAFPPTPCRSTNSCSLFVSSSVSPWNESEPPLYGELFVIIAFPPTNEAATTAEQITGKSILFFFPERTVVVTGRSNHAQVQLRSTFFPSGSLTAVLFIYTGAVITAWSSTFAETFARFDDRSQSRTAFI